MSVNQEFILKKRSASLAEVDELDAVLNRAKQKGAADRAMKKKAKEDAVIQENLRLHREAEEAARQQAALAKKREDKEQRNVHKQEAVRFVVEGKGTVMDAVRYFKQNYGVEYDHKVLERNVASFRRGDGLTHTGPRRFFEASDLERAREEQVQRAVRKEAVEDDDVLKTLSDKKNDIARARAAEKGLLPGDIPGKKLSNMSATSMRVYRGDVLGVKMKAYSQNKARADALHCIYNAISFVVALRAMYGFVYNDTMTGMYDYEKCSERRSPVTMLNIDASSSYLGKVEDIYVWMSQEGAEAAREKGLSVASTKTTAAAPAQKRSIKYLAVVNALADLLAMVSYIKDDSFPESMCDVAQLPTLRDVRHFLIRMGCGPGVHRAAAERLLGEIVSPIMKEMHNISKAPPATAHILSPGTSSSSSSASAPASSSSSSSHTNNNSSRSNMLFNLQRMAALSVASDSDSDADADADADGSDLDVGGGGEEQGEDDAPPEQDQGHDEHSLRHRPVLFLDGEQEQIGAITDSSVKLDSDIVKSASESSPTMQTLDACRSFMSEHSFFKSKEWKRTVSMRDEDVEENALTLAVRPLLQSVHAASRRTFLRYFAVLPMICSSFYCVRNIQEGWTNTGIFPFNQVKILDKCPAWAQLTEAQQQSLCKEIPRLVQLALCKGHVTDGEIEVVVGHIVGAPLRGSDPNLEKVRKEVADFEAEQRSPTSSPGPSPSSHPPAPTAAPVQAAPAVPAAPVQAAPAVHASRALETYAFNRQRAVYLTDASLLKVIQRKASDAANRVAAAELKKAQQLKTQQLKEAREALGIKSAYTVSKALAVQCSNLVCLTDLSSPSPQLTGAVQCRFCTRQFCGLQGCQIMLLAHEQACLPANQALQARREADLQARNEQLLQRAAEEQPVQQQLGERPEERRARDPASASGASSARGPGPGRGRGRGRAARTSIASPSATASAPAPGPTSTTRSPSTRPANV